MDNLILDTDSYKSSHYLQYPPGTTSMFSYFESRGGDYPHVLFFGLQYLLKKYLTQRVTEEMVFEAGAFFGAHGEPFPINQWLTIARDLEGRLPVRIRAVPEGTVVPNQNVLMTVESTLPEAFWVVSWLETQLVRLWYPCTVATRSHAIKQVIERYLVLTADDFELSLPFKLHDFGSRGVSSRESAGIGGAAHLVNFMGSDTVEGVRTANKYYNNVMAGVSIPAAEHSTITAWGRESELAAYRNMLDKFAKPGSLVATVSDSYDLWHAIENFWGKDLRQQIIDSGATVIIRPDSGDPPKVVYQAIKQLDAAFGHTINGKGYKLLNHVRVIQGDGMDDEGSVEDILKPLMLAGYSADNVAFGMGGGLLQKVNRDTQKFAFKCSSVVIDGQHMAIKKDPITDPGKASKAGRLDLVKRKGRFVTTRIGWGLESMGDSVLRTVYENGELLIDDDLETIRERSWERVKVPA